MMCGMPTKYRHFSLLLVISLSLLGAIDANTFLKANSRSHAERISVEEVQTSLLAEVEGTFGEGAASSRLKQIEQDLTPMFAALPKNELGYLSHATVRYALHRLFVQRHGWFIKGLHHAGNHRNSSSNVGLLKEQVPAYVQDVFEKRLNGRGFGLHELGVLAATIEHLVQKEAIKRLGDALKIHKLLPTSIMSEKQVDDVLDMYMTGYILGENLADMSVREAMDAQAEMPDIFMAWNATQEFVRKVRKNIAETESSKEQRSSGSLDFSLAARAAERIGEQFGAFQDHDCKRIKDSLVAMEEHGTGRVRLSDFWKPNLNDPNGSWQFGESLSYLRQLGVLDESDVQHPYVMIANYISSPSNCIASSSFYSVCCMDECEGLLGHLEKQIAAPESTPSRIAALVANLPSSSVHAPRQISTTLLSRLDEIAAIHDGNVQLHGRLFAQWMHHAFPRECPYPHLAGTTNPQTPDEWMENTGEEISATEEEMQNAVKQASPKSRRDAHSDSLPWNDAEELLIARVKPRSNIFGTFVRTVVLSSLVLAMAYRLVTTFAASSSSAHSRSKEHFV